MAYRPDPNGNLGALSLLTSAANRLAYFTGLWQAAVTDLTALGGTETNPDDAIVLKMSWWGWFWE